MLYTQSFYGMPLYPEGIFLLHRKHNHFILFFLVLFLFFTHLSLNLFVFIYVSLFGIMFCFIFVVIFYFNLFLPNENLFSSFYWFIIDIYFLQC